MKKPPPLPNKNKQAFELAMKHLTHQARSVFEISRYLDNKGVDKETALDVISMLIEKKYLDDMQFSLNFVEARQKNKPKSKFAIAYELKKKGIQSDIVENVLSHLNDYDLALKAVESKLSSWRHLDRGCYEKKIMNFLTYRGFSYDISLSILKGLKSSPEYK